MDEILIIKVKFGGMILLECWKQIKIFNETKLEVVYAGIYTKEWIKENPSILKAFDSMWNAYILNLRIYD